MPDTIGYIFSDGIEYSSRIEDNKKREKVNYNRLFVP